MSMDGMISRTAASLSPEQREDFYLALACNAADRGDTRKESIWLYHAEQRSTWQQLEED